MGPERHRGCAFFSARGVRRSVFAGGGRRSGLCPLRSRAGRAAGGRLVVVIPRDDHEAYFDDPADLASYKELLALAARKIALHDNDDLQASFFLTGRYTENTDALMVVWDGTPAQELGGTGDIVRLARERKCPVLHINPQSREVGEGEEWRLLFS